MSDDNDQLGLGEVSTILWRERQLLELLVFKLEEEQLMLASGKIRWLTHATREVEMVLEQIKRVELERAVRVESLALELGLEPGPSLRVLASSAPEPWGLIFTSHRNAFLHAVGEIKAVAESNHNLITKGQQATRETLAWLTQKGPDPETYTHAGSAAHGSGTSHLLNQAL